MWLFFGFRYSFWVAMGLPVAFLGALFVMPLIGMTINMLTMVALLMALGLLMDDAIVIAENIAKELAIGDARHSMQRSRGCADVGARRPLVLPDDGCRLHAPRIPRGRHRTGPSGRSDRADPRAGGEPDRGLPDPPAPPGPLPGAEPTGRKPSAFRRRLRSRCGVGAREPRGAHRRRGGFLALRHDGSRDRSSSWSRSACSPAATLSSRRFPELDGDVAICASPAPGRAHPWPAPRRVVARLTEASPW